MVSIVGLSETTLGYVGFTPGAKSTEISLLNCLRILSKVVVYAMHLVCNSIEWISQSSFDRVVCHCWRKETFSTSIVELIVQGVTEWASKAFALQLFDSMLGLRKLLHMATWAFTLVTSSYTQPPPLFENTQQERVLVVLNIKLYPVLGDLHHGLPCNFEKRG